MIRFVSVAASAMIAAAVAPSASAQFVANSGQVTGSVNGMGTDGQDSSVLNLFFGANNATWTVSETTGSGTTSGGLCDGDDDGDCTDVGESVVATVDATFTATATGLRTGQTVYRVRGNGVTTFDSSGRYTGFINFALTLSQLIITIPGPDPLPVTMTSGVITSTADGTQYGNGLVPPGTYQLPSFALGGSATSTGGGETRTFDWELRVGPEKPCCEPWDNGLPDGRGGQTSSIGVDADWKPMVNAAFDDMWLCEGSIYTINAISGVLNTNSALPKAIVAILPDCNGLPDIRRPLAVAGLRGTRFDVDQDDVPFVLGNVSIDDTGFPDADGFRPIRVNATFGAGADKPLVLKGGAYWVTIIGFSAALNPFDEFFWATSGNTFVKGRPGQFFDGVEFVGSEELCCGCTDYNFCVQGRECKILLDNGGPQAGDFIVLPGSPSLQNGSNTQTRSRAADKIVLPPCQLVRPCYVEAWLWTNCDRAGLTFYNGGCACPPNGELGTEYLVSDCVMGTGTTVTEGNVTLELKKFQWFFNNIPALENLIGRPNRNGANLFISVFGLGDNRQNARAYWAFNERCDRPCDLSFGPGCIRPAPADQNHWRSNQTVPTATILGHDYAFLVAIDDLDPRQPPVVTDTCRADIDRNGQLTVQDLFDFLAAWFAGCP